MPSIHLELIIENDINYGLPEIIDIPVAIHVHKRLEQFIYTSAHKDPATVLAYLENKSLDSNTHLRIVNKTSTVPENNQRLPSTQNTRSVNAKSVSMEYGHILATNISTVDSTGKEIPLFWKHVLPIGVTGASLRKVEDGVETTLDSGFLVDLQAQAIYTNYNNQFDETTGKTTIYYVYPEYDSFASPVEADSRFLNPVSSSDQYTGTGTTESYEPNDLAETNRTKQLLSLSSVAREAIWSDVDISTGKLYTDKQLYTKTTTSSGHTYTFNKGDKWWVKPIAEGMLQPIKPLANAPDYGWYLQFTNGDVRALVNGRTRRFYLPEFNYQNFVPYKPIRSSSRDELKLATKNVLFSNRKDLMIDPSNGLHLTLFVYDQSDVLLRAITTDTNLSGVRYRDSIFYEVGLIDGYDNATGCIVMALDIFNNQKVIANYYYKANSFEYKFINLNPLINAQIRDKFIVFYCVPDVDEADKAIHYLLVDSNGYIVFCSQGPGVGHLNLQLKNTDNTINSDSIIGMKYFSEVDANNFTSLYTAGYDNDSGYMILCEVSVGDFAIENKQETIDIVEPGAKIKEEFLESALLANPRIQNSTLCNAPFGLQIPEENVMIVEAPLSLLEDYGGVLSKQSAEAYLRTLMPVFGYMVIEWLGPSSILTGYYNDSGIYLTMTFEGLYDYKLYRSTDGESKTLLTTFSPTERTLLAYTDAGVESATTYTYYVSLVENDIEYPETTIKIRVP